MAYQNPTYGAQPAYGGPQGAGYQQPGYGQNYGQNYPQQGSYPPPQQGAYPPPQAAYPPQQGSYAPPAPQAGGGTDPIRAWFDAVDQDRSGKITSRELQAALSNGGFRFSAAVVDQLMQMFDRDRSGQLTFMEFKDAHDFIQRMAAGFRARDADGSGMLEGREVRAALAASGYQLSEGTFQIMMRKFDHEQAGGLRFDDYIALSIMLGRTRNVFAFYDRQRSGQVTFNFDSFFCASLSMR